MMMTMMIKTMTNEQNAECVITQTYLIHDHQIWYTYSVTESCHGAVVTLGSKGYRSKVKAAKLDNG